MHTSWLLTERSNGNLVSNSDQFLENSLLGLMSVLQGVSNFAIGVAGAIVQTLIDAILTLLDIMEAMLNEEWDIPLVSGLFSLACPGKPLNLKNLLALILAMPSTIIYKLAYNSTPFPDDQNITNFRNLFNERALAADAGIANGTTATGRIVLHDPAALQVAKTMFGIINSLSAWLSGTFNTCVDSLPPGSEQADTTFIKVLSKGTFTLGLVSQLTAIPWPFKTDGLPPVPFYNGTASEFENLIWVLQWAGIGIDGIYLLADGHLTRSDEDAGAVISSVFGSIYIGLFVALAVWENNSDPRKTAQNLIGGIPGCAKFCRVNALVESSLGISLVALAATDAIGYFTSGTLGFIGCLQPAAQRNQVVLA